MWGGFKNVIFKVHAYLTFWFSAAKVEATGHCLGFAELQSPFVKVLRNGLHILSECVLYSLPCPGVAHGCQVVSISIFLEVVVGRS